MTAVPLPLRFRYAYQLNDHNYTIVWHDPREKVDTAVLSNWCKHLELQSKGRPIERETCHDLFYKDKEKQGYSDLANLAKKQALLIISNPLQEVRVKESIEHLNPNVVVSKVSQPLFQHITKISVQNSLGYPMLNSIKEFFMFGHVQFWMELESAHQEDSRKMTRISQTPELEVEGHLQNMCLESTYSIILAFFGLSLCSTLLFLLENGLDAAKLHSRIIRITIEHHILSVIQSVKNDLSKF